MIDPRHEAEIAAFNDAHGDDVAAWLASLPKGPPSIIRVPAEELPTDHANDNDCPE